jgi:hypothetical protein
MTLTARPGFRPWVGGGSSLAATTFGLRLAVRRFDVFEIDVIETDAIDNDASPGSCVQDRRDRE